MDYRPSSALIPFAENARTHSEAQVAQVAASIREFGWTNPILVDGDNGNGVQKTGYAVGLSKILNVCSPDGKLISQ